VNLSVIVSVFNAESTIGSCLGALLAELDAEDEIIVVNDCSTDSTKDVLSDPLYHNIKVIHLTNNKGQGFCRNFGTSYAQSKSSAFVFVDSDIEVLPGCFSIIKKAYQEDDQLSALTGMISLIHPFENFCSQYKNIYMNSTFSRLPDYVNFLYGGICSVKSREFIAWPEKNLFGEDTQLGLLLASQGKKTKLMKELQVIHHKYYSFFTLIKNDFLIPFGFAESFLFFLCGLSQGKFKNQESQFSHVSPKQILSLLLSSGAMLLGVSAFFYDGNTQRLIFLIFASLILAVSLLNAYLLLALFETKGVLFALKGFVWTLFDQVTMTCGAFCGLVYYGKIAVWSLISKKSTKETLELP